MVHNPGNCGRERDTWNPLKNHELNYVLFACSRDNNSQESPYMCYVWNWGFLCSMACTTWIHSHPFLGMICTWELETMMHYSLSVKTYQSPSRLHNGTYIKDAVIVYGYLSFTLPHTLYRQWLEVMLYSSMDNSVNRKVLATASHHRCHVIVVKVEIGLFLMQDLPKLGMDLSSGTLHTISVHILSKTECQIPIGGHWNSPGISLNPKRQGDCVPFHLYTANQGVGPQSTEG